MTVPKENISNTVLLRALPIAPVSQTWPMLLNTKDGNINDQVELWRQDGAAVDKVDPAGGNGYTIEIQNPNYWEFVINWTGAQPTGDTLYVFRRTRGVVEAFTVGAFLSAEALNQRFDLDNLGINDTAYYQSKTNPMYSKQAIAEKGVPDTTSGVPFKNPVLPEGDLNLPYLGSASSTPGDVYTWGKKIDNSGTGTGTFEPVLIGSSSGGGTVAQLVQELADCTSSGTAGGNLIGLWSAANPAIGWNPPLSGCFPGGVEGWFERMISTGPNPGDTGGTQVGMRITGTGNYPTYNTGGNETNVQTYGNAFHNFGDANDRFYESGSSFVGYSGWGLNTPVVAPDGKTYNANTVAGCLNRLNEDAISPTASGAAHVKWWSTNQSSTFSVQDGLQRLSSITRLQGVLTGGSTGPLVIGQLPSAAIGSVGAIDYIVFWARNEPTELQYSLVITDVSFTTRYSMYPVYLDIPIQSPMKFSLEVQPAGDVEVRKNIPLGGAPANNFTVGATIYLKADY